MIICFIKIQQQYKINLTSFNLLKKLQKIQLAMEEAPDQFQKRAFSRLQSISVTKLETITWQQIIGLIAIFNILTPQQKCTFEWRIHVFQNRRDLLSLKKTYDKLLRQKKYRQDRLDIRGITEIIRREIFIEMKKTVTNNGSKLKIIEKPLMQSSWSSFLRLLSFGKKQNQIKNAQQVGKYLQQTQQTQKFFKNNKPFEIIDHFSEISGLSVSKVNEMTIQQLSEQIAIFNLLNSQQRQSFEWKFQLLKTRRDLLTLEMSYKQLKTQNENIQTLYNLTDDRTIKTKKQILSKLKKRKL